MNRRGGILFTVILTISALVRPAITSRISGPPNSAPRPPKHDKSATVKPLESTKDGEDYQSKKLKKRIREFYEAGSADASEEIWPKTWGVPPESQRSIHFILASIPDPLHTHLGLYFDREIEAIQQAAQARSFVFDRAALPWDNKDHPEPDDFSLRQREMDWKEGRENLPGLLIFRAARGPSPAEDSGNESSAQAKDTPENADALFVFVVGETPTGGIHKAQFLKALQIIQDIRGRDPEEPLSFLGPTFSGSLHSLYQLLSAKNKLLPKKIFIHSGSVTSWAATQLFTESLKESLDVLECAGEDRKVEFISFQESDRYQILRLIEFAAQQGYPAKSIAVLSEDETVYGSFSSHPNRQAPSKKKKCKQQPEPSEPPPQTPNATTQTGDSQTPEFCLNPANLETCEGLLVQLYFPREISHLRAAYQQDIYAEHGSSNTDKGAARSSLKLDLDTVGSDDDSVPAYSRKQLPLSQEAVLLGIVRVLREHKPSFIVLRATDSIDQIFLSRFLKQAYGEGRIITIGADQLFQREEENMLLHGTLAITPYSLLPEIDHLMFQMPHSGKAHVDRVSSSVLSVGVYNAMLSLLAKNGPGLLAVECATKPAPAECNCRKPPDLPEAALADYGWPSLGGVDNKKMPCMLAPPLWLTVVGHSGYWPLALLDSLDQQPANDQVKSRLHAVKVNAELPTTDSDLPKSKSWDALCTICLLGAGLHLLLLWKGSVLSRSEAIARFAPVKKGHRSVLLAFASAFILAIVVMLSTITGGSTLSWLLRITIWLLLILPALDQARRGSWVTGAAYFILALMMTWVLKMPAGVSSSHPSFWNLIVYRATHVNSGVSPLLPFLLLCVAGYAWAWHNLAGMALLDRRRPRLFQLPAEQSNPERSLIGIAYKESGHLINIAKPFTFEKAIVLPLAILLCFAIAVVDYRHPLQSLEGQGYDWAYAVLLGILLAVLLVNLLRLFVIWVECRRFLQALDRLPLRRAFKRLKGFSWKPIWRFGGSGIRDSYNLVSREFESASHLLNQMRKTRGLFQSGENQALEKAIEELFQQRDTLFKTYAEGFNSHRVMRDFKSFQKQLAEACRLALVGQPAWHHLVMRDFKSVQEKMADACGLTLKILVGIWRKEIGLVADGGAMESEAGKAGEEQAERRAETPGFTDIAEEFVGLTYVNFILTFLLRIRTLILSMSAMYIFILFSLSSYPFEPQSALRSLLIGLFLVIGAAVVTVYAQMHRDATLSHITDTKPGELGVDFWFKLAAFGAVPLLSLLASQFPGIGGFLFSWLQPALEALK